MKHHFKILYLLLSCNAIYLAQNFTWVTGLTTSGVITGTYGTQAVASTTNNPGTRHGAATWVDASGNLWLMGGEGTSSVATTSWLNDMWKYNPATFEWTWVRGSNGPNAIGIYGTQGVPSTTNQPGAREFSVTWTDAAGNFWLLGGDGYASTTSFGRLGDLWKYSPTANTWTWMKGFNTVDQNGIFGTQNISSGTNNPGARFGAATWVDPSGNLWLFGGRGFGASGLSGFLNDLWKYNPTNNEWTWVKGSTVFNQTGIYGTLNTPSTGNAPGGREFPAFWSDGSGNLYLCGGRGYASTALGYQNDLWKYNILAGTWTWINGSNNSNPPAVFGVQGIASSTNSPGGRYTPASWKDLQGNFWMFGGLSWAITSATNTNNALNNTNDLWKYNTLTNQWTWMKGSQYVDVTGTYGTQMVANTSNMPGARHFNTWWKEQYASFCLFGGEGMDATVTIADNLNDLWAFVPPCNPDSVTTSQGFQLCNGNSTTLTANNQFPANVQWYTSPTGTTSIGSGSVLLTGTLTPNVYTYYAQSNGCTVTPRTLISFTVNAPPIVSISGSTQVCQGNTLMLSGTGATSYSWSTGSFGSTLTLSLGITTVVFVIGTSTNGCQNTASITISVNPLPTLSIVASKTAVCASSGETVAITASGGSSYSWSNGSTTNSTVVTPSVPSVYGVTCTNSAGCQISGTIQILVNPSPTLSITASKTIVCKGETKAITLTATGANSYTWETSATTSTISITPTVPVNPGNGPVTVTVVGSDVNSCKNTAAITLSVSNCTGVSDSEINHVNLSIAPNPNKGSFSIGYSGQITSTSVRIIDMLGKHVYYANLSNERLEINVNLPSGYYLVQVIEENVVLTNKKLLIE